MSRNYAVVAVLFAVFAAHAHAQGVSHKDPRTGRECVTSSGIERKTAGYVQLNFQNICGRTFAVRVRPAKGSGVRGGGIGPGTPGNPARIHLTCKAADGCESGEWWYQ